MSRYLILFLLALISTSTHIHAQSQAGLDSLRKVLPGQKDTSRINTLVQFAKYFYVLGEKPDSIGKYGQMALEESRKLDFTNGLHKALHCMAVMHTRKKEYEKSNEYNFQALDLVKQLNNLNGVAAVLNNIGMNYMVQGKYLISLRYFFESLSVEEILGQEGNASQVLNNIAISYTRLHQSRKAITYKLKAIEEAKSLGDDISVLQSSVNISFDYMQLGKSDSARYFANQCLQLSEKYGVKEGIIRARHQLSRISLEEGKFQQAIDEVQRSNQHIDPEVYPGLQGSYYRLLATALDSLGNYFQATEYAMKALEIHEGIGEPSLLMNNYELLYDLYKKQGQAEKALAYQEKYKALHDNSFSMEKNNEIQNLLAQFESEKQAQEKASLEQQNQIQQLEINQKNILILSIITGGVLSILLIFLFYRQRVMKEKHMALEAKQKSLLVQMNPHFLFHSLSAIQQFIYEQEDKKTAGEYLAKFAKLMRLILENSRELFIPLEREIETLKFYLELQKMRFNHGFEYEIKLSPDIDPEEILIPPMFAQPFIENSLEHGLIHKNQEGIIQLSFQMDGDKLHFSVVDNGVGRKEAALMKKRGEHRSLAIEITRDRLELLRKKINKPFDFQITDLTEGEGQAGGTQVNFSLPVMNA